MAYQLKYRLQFDTTAGADIDWRLDIHQEGYTGSIQDMIGGVEPAKIDYIANQDIYSPVVTSKMDIDLIVPEDTRTVVSYGDNINADTEIAGTFPTNVLIRVDADSTDNDQIFFTGTADAVGTINEANTTGWIFYNPTTGDEFALPNSSNATWNYTSSNTRYSIQTPNIGVPQWLLDQAYLTNPISGNRTEYSIRTSTWTGDGTATDVEIVRKTSSTERYYDDFSILNDANGNPDPRAYKVYLRYKKAADTDYDTYWVGFITPQDQQESFTTVPYNISITATDGFNLIVDQNVKPFDGLNPTDTTKVREFIFSALFETGTQLDIRDYTDIRVTDSESNEQYALTEVEVNEFTYADEDFTATIKEVDAAKDVLTVFNARVFQSKGYWCIISNSNHAATIASDAENIPYKLWSYNETTEAWEDQGETTDENALVEFPTTATLAYNDAVTINRRPLFSYNRDVSTQMGTVKTTNTFFSDDLGTTRGEVGPVWVNRGVGANIDDDVTNYGTVRNSHAATDNNVRGSHYIRTTRTNNLQRLPGNRDVWIEQTIDIQDFFDFDKDVNVIFRQDWTDANAVTHDIVKADIGVSIVCVVDADQDDFWVWNFEDKEWDFQDSPPSTAKDKFWTRIETDPDNRFNWQASSLGSDVTKGRDPANTLSDVGNALTGNIAPILGIPEHTVVGTIFKWIGKATTGLLSAITGNSLESQIADWVGSNDFTGTLRIRIGDIRAYNSDGNAIATQNIITTDIDSVALSYVTEPLTPHYEAYQTQFSEQGADDVMMFSQGPDFYRGSLNYNDYYRNGVTETKFLEEIVLRQKMADYKTGLKFYQGTLIPNTGEGPIHLVDKILNNTTDAAETISGIQYYLKVSPRGNKYDTNFYISNQPAADDSDISYGTTDVFPFKNRYTWKSARFGYEYEFDLSAVVLPDTITTAADGAVAIGDIEITVDDTTGFADSGFITSGTNEIFYASKTATTFAGIPATGDYSVTEAIADDGDINAGIESYVTLDIPKVVSGGIQEPGIWSFTKYGQEDENYRSVVSITPTDGFEVGGFGASNLDSLIATNVEFFKSGATQNVSFEYTIDDYLESEQFEITGNVTTLVGNNSSIVLTATDSLTKATIEQGTGDITDVGPVGATESFFYYIKPDDLNEINADLLSVTLTSVKDGPDSDDNNVSGVVTEADIRKYQSGTGVLVEVPLVYVPTSPVYVKIDFQGTAVSVGTLNQVDIQIKAVGTGTDFVAGEWDVADGDVTIKGLPGDRFIIPIELNPISGFYIQSTSVTVTDWDESWSGNYKVTASQQTMSEGLVWLYGTFPTTDAIGDNAANITIDLSTGVPGNVDANAHSYSWAAGTGYFFNNSSNSFSAELTEGESASFTISMEATSGSQLGTVDLSSTNKTVTYDVDVVVSSLPSAVSLRTRDPRSSNGIVEHIDFIFDIVGVADGEVDTISFTGDAGTQDNLYTLRYDVEIDTEASSTFNGVLQTNFIDIPFGDADLGDNISSLRSNTTNLDGNVAAGATSITVDDTTGFPTSGYCKIDGDVFSYTGVTATTFTGIPSTGNYALIAHSDNDEVLEVTVGTFLVTSADPSMMYSATTDITVTSPTGFDSENTISDGVILVTLFGNFPSTVPSTGIEEVIFTVSGEADTLVPATSAGSSLTRIDNNGTININGGFGYVDIVANGPWEFYAFDGFGSDGRSYTTTRSNGLSGTYNTIQFTYDQEFFTKSGTSFFYLYLMKAGLLTQAQITEIAERTGTQAERDAIGTILQDTDNQLASRIQINSSSVATAQPGIFNSNIEIVESLPATPNASKIYIVTG